MHECKFEDLVREMHGDIKALVVEFENMNGALKDTKRRFDLHSEESDVYRQKTTTIWTVLMTVKWLAMLLFGSGLIWKAIESWR